MAIEMSDLTERSKEYELEGVEFTEEDVAYANKLMDYMSRVDAISETLSGIREVLDNGLD